MVPLASTVPENRTFALSASTDPLSAWPESQIDSPFTGDPSGAVGVAAGGVWVPVRLVGDAWYLDGDEIDDRWADPPRQPARRFVPHRRNARGGVW